MCGTISLKVGIINKKKKNGQGEESNMERVLWKIEFEKFERRTTKKGPQEHHFKDRYKFLTYEERECEDDTNLEDRSHDSQSYQNRR